MNTEIGIDTLEAGSELDALVDALVMTEWAEGETPIVGYGHPPAYSTDIAAAWPVAEKVGLTLIPVAIYPTYEGWNSPTPDNPDKPTRTAWIAIPWQEASYEGRTADSDEHLGPYMGVIDENLYFDMMADTAPLAICKAALRIALTHTP